MTAVDTVLLSPFRERERAVEPSDSMVNISSFIMEGLRARSAPWRFDADKIGASRKAVARRTHAKDESKVVGRRGTKYLSIMILRFGDYYLMIN